MHTRTLYVHVYYRTKNISNDGPEPLDANSVVTARTSSNQVTRGWNYHQVKQWYFSLYQRLCATKKANEANLASANAHSVSMRPVYSDGAPAGMQQQQTSGATNGRGTKRTYPGITTTIIIITTIILNHTAHTTLIHIHIVVVTAR